MSIFTTDQAIIDEGVRYFSVIGFCYLLPCVTNGLQGYFRGTKMMLPSLLATLTQISVRVIATLWLVPLLGIPAVGIACVAGWSAMTLWAGPCCFFAARRKARMGDSQKGADIQP